MDIASLSAISGIENISKYADNSLQTEKSKGSGTASFDSLLNSAMNLDGRLFQCSRSRRSKVCNGTEQQSS